jgi:nucleoside-diphosphate-sugar epimerase
VNIVVTGGSGLAGTFVVAELVRYGHRVTILDQAPPQERGLPYRLVDLSDLGQVYGALPETEAIIHLGAIPRPTFHPPGEVFRTNMLATYNIFEVAAARAVPRVIYASSMSVLGYPFYHRFFEPLYAPIDEAHPPLPQDSYALSKYLGEAVAQAFVRRGQLTAISLRLTWIHTPQSFKEIIVPLRQEGGGAAAASLWLYVDSRDVAQAFRLALSAELSGHEAFFISAPNSFMDTPTAELLRRYYPNTEIRPQLQGQQAVITSTKAERVLGFKANYTWESYF